MLEEESGRVDGVVLGHCKRRAMGEFLVKAGLAFGFSHEPGIGSGGPPLGLGAKELAARAAGLLPAALRAAPPAIKPAVRNPKKASNVGPQSVIVEDLFVFGCKSGPVLKK